MTDSRRSLSPPTRVFSLLQDLSTFDQIPPLINSVAILDTMSDEEIARQHQEDLYNVQSMDVDETFPHAAAPINLQTPLDLDADEAYALQLQEEEYSRRSLNPFRSYRQSTTNKRQPPPLSAVIDIDTDNPSLLTDAELAARLQAEEEQQQQGRRQQQRPPYTTRRPPFPSQRTTNSILHSNEPEVIPIQRPTLRRPPRNNNTNNANNAANDFANVLQRMTANSLFRSNGRRIHDPLTSTDDFDPNDYERLLELDNTVQKNTLTDEQINRLPTEKFQGAKSKNDEENKCSVCWDDFEQNQVLRRLRCFHLYHKVCIDKWLKDKNQCPICRIPAIV